MSKQTKKLENLQKLKVHKTGKPETRTQMKYRGAKEREFLSAAFPALQDQHGDNHILAAREAFYVLHMAGFQWP
jgi:hypothetical protein